MNLCQVKAEIADLGKIPAAERMYPITSEWVPITDVLAIVDRFEKHWRQMFNKDKANSRIIVEMLGET
jgi:uncharacterized membrane protein YesL